MKSLIRSLPVMLLGALLSSGCRSAPGLPITEDTTRCVGIECPAPTACQDPGVCDPKSGTCTYAPRPDGQDCDDGDVCTLHDSCVAGRCVGGAPQTCRAADQCNVAGVCDPKTGCGKMQKADGTTCDDGDLCTQNDACTGGVCTGTPQTCAGGSECSPTGVCNAGTGQCDYSPAQTGTDCTLFPGAANETLSFCKAGVCQYACPVGFTDCNHNQRTDGCEVFTGGDPDNCGGCAASCSANNVAVRSCAQGQCGGTCVAGFADCQGTARLTGCQTNLLVDFANCGGCGIACLPVGSNNLSASSCANGSCAGTCAVPYVDCNQNLVLDGCEKNVHTDEQNCGSCGRQCPGDTTCEKGLCRRGSYTMGANGYSPGSLPACYSGREACALRFGPAPTGWRYSTSTQPDALTFSAWAMDKYLGFFTQVRRCLEVSDTLSRGGLWSNWFITEVTSAYINDTDGSYNFCRNRPNYCFLVEAP